MRELLERVDRHWAADDIPHGPPVSAADIAEVEERYGVRLPAELREWFLGLNGMDSPAYPMDEHGLAFHPLSGFRPLAEEAPSMADAPDAERLFVFADLLVWCSGYAVLLTAEAAETAPVFVVHAANCILPVATSFSAFLEGYLAGDEAVLFPEPPAAWRAEFDLRRAERLAAAIDPTEEKPRLANPDRVTRRLTRFAHAYARATRQPPGEVVVTVRMRIDRNGEPGDISVERPAPDPALDAEATAAAAEMRFRPATVGGMPVAVWITLPITFRFSHRPRPLWKRLLGR
jgi:TonB family protein